MAKERSPLLLLRALCARTKAKSLLKKKGTSKRRERKKLRAQIKRKCRNNYLKVLETRRRDGEGRREARGRYVTRGRPHGLGNAGTSNEGRLSSITHFHGTTFGPIWEMDFTSENGKIPLIFPVRLRNVIGRYR